jgi:aspartate ammonia-lyase
VHADYLLIMSKKEDWLMTRTETDLLGEVCIPGGVYWGVHTARAIDNFAITGRPISAYPALIRALAAIKYAAARSNAALGLLDEKTAWAISAACEEIMQGQFHDQFVVDAIQGGAGTSTNMNANEVITNRALELMGRDRGSYSVLHPIDHVNLGQSTNDVYPSALKLGLREAALSILLPALRRLAQAFSHKADAFDAILKIGRTQLQDAVPMTLGQEFRVFGDTLRAETARLDTALQDLVVINLGGTAIGTGINCDARFAAIACGHLSGVYKTEVRSAANLIEATQDTSDFVTLSSALKRIAVKLSKIANDLRLLSSGPVAGLQEINLPPRAAGSSIMPGKVNPVIPEAVNQVCFQIIGNDVAVTMASEAGQLQLNAFEPLIGHLLFDGINLLAAACTTLTDHCVSGITANAAHLAHLLEHSAGIATALNPHLGYEKASLVAKEAVRSGSTVAAVVLKMELMDAKQLSALLRPETLTQPCQPALGGQKHFKNGRQA